MKYLDDPLTRAIYASDASNYRIPPARVALPANGAELRDAVLDALASGTPLTMRGRGTSCSGNAIGPGLVIDTAHGCNRILDFDPGMRTITVEPGVVLAAIQETAAPHGLRFGPDPSTWTRATIGGSIGNNACGPHAQAWGRVADNVLEMQVIDGFGREFTAGAGAKALDVVPGLERLVQENLALIRTECGRFRRQVSGYSLEHLLPENGRDLAKFLVGSEGTLACVTAAKLRLVPVPAAPVLVVLGYPDMIAAAADVPLVNTFRPLAVEGMDSRLVDTLRAKPGAGEIPTLPAGKGWLLVEMGGAEEPLEATLERARDLAAAANTAAAEVYPPGTEATRLWRIRADGAGLGGRTPVAEAASDSQPLVHEAPAENPGATHHRGSGKNPGQTPHETAKLQGNQPAWPGFEDAAVPPENLAAYLQDFTALMRETEVDGMLYGHLGDGCLHVRLSLPLGAAATDGRARDFLECAADLVAKHGGSISGEHGDGRARSELLPRMYSRELIRLFSEVKALFDPRGLMNPGVLVDPAPLDANLRLATARPIPAQPGRGFTFPHDEDLSAAFHRCTGVGKCLAMDRIAGAWMCPSYLATGEEKDATRGRARALQEVANGGLIRDFRDPALLEALDLCLACKACSTACPTGIDLAAFRSEAFSRAYRGRPWARPGSHFLLGWLPFWLRLARRVPGGARLANALFGLDWLRRLVFRVFGLAPERQMATFATQSFRQWLKLRNSARPLEAHVHTLGRSERAHERQRGKYPPRSVLSYRTSPLSLSFASRSLRALRFLLSPLRALRFLLNTFTIANDDASVSDIAGSEGGSGIREKNGSEVVTHEQGNRGEREQKPWVAVWADSFSEGIDPDGAEAAVELLERAGYRVFVPRQACCGLTYITTGQLDLARGNLRRLCQVLGPLAVNGIPIIGVEPSCTATLRDDLERLLPDDPRATAIARATRTLAELLTDPELGPGGTRGPGAWQPPNLAGVEVVAQPHCHHYSVMGWRADRELLARAGAQVTELSGCCGMAGNFGMEAGHLEVSKQVAAHSLLPALEAHPDAVFLADGFSCRTQATQLAGCGGVHLARLLLG